MESIGVALGSRSYPIHIGVGLVGRAELYRPYLGGGSAAIVTNDVVAPLYLSKVRDALQGDGDQQGDDEDEPEERGQPATALGIRYLELHGMHGPSPGSTHTSLVRRAAGAESADRQRVAG